MHSRIELLIYLMSLFQLFTEPCVKGYNIKCPGPFQRIFRSEGLCNSNGLLYTCLYNTYHLQYSEICIEKEYQSRKGRKRVFSPAINEIDCEDDKFQPIPFTTNDFTDCMLRKSKCIEEGQVIISNGSTFIDRTCKCDYDRGYVYVTQPKDKCSCVPSQEDCSCFLKHCKENEILSADYDCVPENSLRSTICGDILDRIVPSEETVTVDTCDKIQLQQISGSGTWSNQAAVFLIVVVIIFTVLIGFLFFSVPCVTSILLNSKLELSLKRKENEFMILIGDNVKIEFNVESYIPVRSVTWQKEKDGEIIQITLSDEKYQIDFMKRPSLTINDFNAEDQGKYRCIVKNVIGLRNEMFGSCMHYMLRLGWLTAFVSVLQHIPAFHTEDITLHNYDIDSQSTPTVYNVYKGDDITIEQHTNDQQKLTAIKWLKETVKWTGLDLSNEQYTGGVPEVPSLTIKATTLGNAGKYFCLLIYDKEETQKALFKLKIIPQVKTYKALSEHREDKTFIRPGICDFIDQHLQENNIVIITGREGTGKSKLCLELASVYEENDYRIMKVNLSENYTDYTDMVDAFLIIDNQQYTQDSLNAFMKHLSPLLLERNIKVILTCRNLDLGIVRSVLEINKFKDKAFIDLNNCLTTEEKEEMLRSYMKVNQVTSSSSAVSNFRSLEIITDFSVQVTLDENAIKEIRNEEPWKGFPLSASLFCSDRKFLHLGGKYFTNPPRHLVEELKKLYEAARKTSNCIDKINEYCVLVYIMNNKKHQLDLNDHNLCSQLDVLYQTCFSFKNKPEKPGSNEEQKKAIEEAVHRMNNKYLKFHEGVYKFIHPCLLKAMFLSSESMVHYLLQNGSLLDITEFVRSEDYTSLENELVIKIGQDYHHILCERLARHAFENHSLLLHVAHYIYSYWHSSGNNLVNEMFKHIEFILFRSLEIHTNDILSHDVGSLSENSINLEGSVQFSKIIMLLDELTYKGRDPWIYGPGSADFLILSALISSAYGRYTSHREQTFTILLNEFRNRINLKSFVTLLSKPVDTHGNTFFHYLMLFGEMEATHIFTVNEETQKFELDTENLKKYTPLDIAAFLGKRNILNVLNLMTKFSKKLRDRLKRLAESGKVEYYYENYKHKNIDQPMVYQINDDSDSPKKHEYEDADDVKKGVKNEVKKNRSIFKRKSSMRKEEPSEKEKHDKNDVLCFDDFMINTVVFGGKEDYQSILTLLS